MWLDFPTWKQTKVLCHTLEWAKSHYAILTIPFFLCKTYFKRGILSRVWDRDVATARHDMATMASTPWHRKARASSILRSLCLRRWKESLILAMRMARFSWFSWWDRHISDFKRFQTRPLANPWWVAIIFAIGREPPMVGKLTTNKGDDYNQQVTFVTCSSTKSHVS